MAGVVTLVISIVSLCTSMAVFYWQRRHGDFDLARMLHADLTTGEVARARDVLGTFIHDPRTLDSEDLRDVRTAYFTVLWCFERLYAGRRAIRDGGAASRRPLRFLDHMISGQVSYWDQNLPWIREELEQHPGGVHDSESLRAFTELRHAVLRR
ncbi:hypothetical protein [Streptomyces flavofungini]|uniref:hypothetical protein n=1 Tax=Streptomyces flavofungini TaxID=68200 RepID=UPI0025B2015A|nr:hypothetical protein [Streptomyces flavofungini]WJV51752.1 hypothetical protein QUY26_39685 [Streptomyces flavofungini]